MVPGSKRRTCGQYQLPAGLFGLSGPSGAEPGAVVESDAKTEAVQALTALGYANSDALRAVRRAEITEDMDTETILKLALKQLAFL